MRGAVRPLPQYVFMAWCLIKDYAFMAWYLVKHRDNLTLPYLTKVRFLRQVYRNVRKTNYRVDCRPFYDTVPTERDT